MGQTAYDECVEQIDQAAGQYGSGTLTAGELNVRIAEAVGAYLTDDDPRDDLDLLLQYAVTTVTDLTSDPVDGDRSAATSLERLIRGRLDAGAAKIDVAERLGRIRRAHRRGDTSGQEALVALCRSGLVDHPRLYMFADHVEATLWAAHDLGIVPALVAAVHPAEAHRGQIASADHFGGGPRRLAFDLLAALAARGPNRGTLVDRVGPAARDALVELAGHLDTAGPALVRLTVHQLDTDHRRRLGDLLDGYEDLLARDPVLLPSTDAVRLPDVVRGVLWQANDAAHLA